MLGHGSPFVALRVLISMRDQSPIATSVLKILLFVSVCWCAQTLPAQDPQPDQFSSYRNNQLVETRLRVSWGSPENERWTGKVELKGGEFNSLTNLILNDNSAGDIFLKEGAIHIRQSAGAKYGGFDISVRGEQDAKLQLTMGPDTESLITNEVPVKQLLLEPFSKDVKESGRISIQRAPGDLLQFSTVRKDLIFSPKELFKFSLRANATQLNTKSLRCRMSVKPAREKKPILLSKTYEFELDDSGTGGQQAMEFAVPALEGVYDVTFELDPKWSQPSLNARRTDVSRTVQIVVLAEKQKVNPVGSRWENIGTLDALPEDIGQDNRWPLNNRTAKYLGNDNRFRLTTGENEQFLQLTSGGWHAMPLPVKQPGMPHILEIEYQSNLPMAMGLSILEPDESNQVGAFGFDTGVFVPENRFQTTDSAFSISQHRFVFWPKTKDPYLLIANRHSEYTATCGKIRVYAGPEQLMNQESDLVEAANPNRRFMAFYETPAFAENFGGSKRTDNEMQQPLDDWLTFYRGAERLIQQLKAGSYRGAFINVADHGSALYPSQLLQPSPKYDGGVFFSNGQDPFRKDVLKLLFRMFEREGLKLVPVLTLTGRLPEVERLRNEKDPASSFELFNYRAQRRSQDEQKLPQYNPLDIRVQKSVSKIVEEVAVRYSDFESFEGVSLACRPDTCTLLPGREWGYDQTTINRFKSDLNLDFEFDGSNPPQCLFDDHQVSWLTWRTKQMTEWYLLMSQTIARNHPGAQLYILPTDIYRNEELASSLSPSLHLSNSFEQSMFRMGFDKKTLSNHPDVVLMQPRRVTASQQAADQKVALNVGHSKKADQYFSFPGGTSAIFYHRGSWAHFAELQEQLPFGSQRSPLVRLQQLTPSEEWNRARFATSLKANDVNLLVDGGWSLAAGQQGSVSELISVFNQLPNKRFETIPSASVSNDASPIAVRNLKRGNEQLFYAVNGSPWPVEVVVSVDGKMAADPVSLSTTSFNVTTDETESQIRFTLEPFGLVGARIPRVDQGASGMTFRNYEFELPEHASQSVRAYLQRLQSKLVKASRADEMKVLENSNFQNGSQPSLVGWTWGDQPTSSVQLDAKQGHLDQSSLKLSSKGKPSWIRSQEFPCSQTGRLSVAVWLKVEDPSNQPPLRLSIEGQRDGTTYYRFGAIGSLAPESNTKQVSNQWQRFAVHFDDLPNGGLNKLRVGFDLMGDGTVWIDNVQVFDRWFDENDTQAMTQMLAVTGKMLSNPKLADACRRVLDGYWPRFLDENFGEEIVEVNSQSTFQIPASNEDSVRTSNNLMRRMRRLVPRRNPFR